ncbi:MAG TPA: VCBS repeat-containing protein [Proteobacteria bacterium]|nr:VCBS repeat-containing protein [Pseudomonadota bacterium]
MTALPALATEFSSPAESQLDYLSATAGASSGATVKVDKNIQTMGSPAKSDVSLEWDASPDLPETGGYLLYYGNASGKYLDPIDVGSNTSHTINSLSTKLNWYFAVKAYDGDGNFSDYSNEVVKEALFVKTSTSGSTASTAMTFTYDPLVLEEYFGQESEPATTRGSEGGLAGGRIVAGTGPWPSEGGWIKTLTDDYFHDHWSRLDWPHYNQARGESRLARGDIDGDGKDEIIVGMGAIAGDELAPAGYFQVLDDNYQHLFWGQVDWDAYNEGNGETWPACGDIDGDGRDEILIGLGRGGMGIIEVFKVSENQLVHHSWMASTWSEYNLAHGEVRPSSGGDFDGDGRDDVVIGLATVEDDPEIPGGNFEILSSYGAHLSWGKVGWADYNQLNGETRPAIGDLDGDGNHEIVIGLGHGANGALEIQALDENGTLTNKTWLEIPWWQEYNELSGETRPALGNLDNDPSDELVVALGQGGGGWLHLFDDAESGYNQYLSLQLWPHEYNLNCGESWVIIQHGGDH